MALISIKAVKPFVEQKVSAKGYKDSIVIGTRVYRESEKAAIRKAYIAKFSTMKLSRWAKELEELKENTSLNEDEFNERVEFLETSIAGKNDEFMDYQDTFCREHIAYFKNTTVTITEEGKTTDLVIVDSREVKPVESLWDSPEECLVVLLDYFLDEPAYRDSLHKAVSDAIFSTDFKGLEAKN